MSLSVFGSDGPSSFLLQAVMISKLSIINFFIKVIDLIYGAKITFFLTLTGSH